MRQRSHIHMVNPVHNLQAPCGCRLPRTRLWHRPWVLHGCHPPSKGFARHKEGVVGVSNFCTLFSEVRPMLGKLSPYLSYFGQFKGDWIKVDHSPLVSSSAHSNGHVLWFYQRVVFCFYFSAGLGDMAVSNTVGSNVFDILVGLGVPWGLQTMAIDYGSTVCILSKSFICTFIQFLKYPKRKACK